METRHYYGCHRRIWSVVIQGVPRVAGDEECQAMNEVHYACGLLDWVTRQHVPFCKSSKFEGALEHLYLSPTPPLFQNFCRNSNSKQD